MVQRDEDIDKEFLEILKKMNAEDKDVIDPKGI